MTFEYYIYSGTKRLRCGYTTGSCAALAAKAATTMVLSQQKQVTESIVTPSGIPIEVDIVEAHFTADKAWAGVVKDSGDDIDATDGLVIYASAERRAHPSVSLTVGKGVGHVTKPGLDQPVGAAAINSVPRKMIIAEVEAVCEKYDYRQGIEIEISVPEGEQAAQKTFNANVGIEGGISILGTSGIVEPRSLSALRDSIELEIRQASEMGKKQLIITLGNYGSDYVRRSIDSENISLVSCANFIGDSLDFAARYRFDEVLLVGHIGKLVKVAGGIMDTHSRVADCRMEILCAHAARAGADQKVAAALLGSVTTDACLEILKSEGLLAPTMQSLSEAIDHHLQRRVSGAYKIAALVFSNQHGELCRTAYADEIMHTMRGVS